VTEFYEFDEEAINYLLDLTGRHPYFTQAVCFMLFFHWKQQQFRRATCADVLAILGDTTNSTMNNLLYLWIEATIAEKFVLAAIAAISPSPDMWTLDRHLKQAGIHLGRKHIKMALKGLYQRELISSTTHPRINLGILRQWLRRAKGLWSVRQQFGEYLPPVLAHQEAGIEPVFTVALTTPWVRAQASRV
jgi:hypothetical protein